MDRQRTVPSGPVWKAITIVSVDKVFTGSVVVTRIAVAVINVGLTKATCNTYIGYIFHSVSFALQKIIIQYYYIIHRLALTKDSLRVYVGYLYSGDPG